MGKLFDTGLMGSTGHPVDWYFKNYPTGLLKFLPILSLWVQCILNSDPLWSLWQENNVFLPESITEMTLEVRGGKRLEINTFQAPLSVFETAFPPSFELFWPWSPPRYLCCLPDFATLWLSCTAWKITCAASSIFFPSSPLGSSCYYLANRKKRKKTLTKDVTARP